MTSASPRVPDGARHTFLALELLASRLSRVNAYADHAFKALASFVYKIDIAMLRAQRTSSAGRQIRKQFGQIQPRDQAKRRIVQCSQIFTLAAKSQRELFLLPAAVLEVAEIGAQLRRHVIEC